MIMFKTRDRSASQQVKDEEEVAPVVRNLEYMQLWTSTRSMLKITLISLHDLMTTMLNRHWSHLRTNSQFPLLDHRGGSVGPIVGGRHLASCSWSVSGIIVVWSPSLSELSLSLCLTLSPPQIKNISKGTSSAGTISSSSSSSALEEKVKGLQFTSTALKCLQIQEWDIEYGTVWLCTLWFTDYISLKRFYR